MVRIAFREIAIFLALLPIIPVILFVAMLKTNTADTAWHILTLAMTGKRSLPTYSPIAFWAKVLSPYLLLQAVRAFIWSHASISARRWAYAYFTAIPLAVGIWEFMDVWELFYLMYALGDVPGELHQLVHIEGDNLVTSGLCFALAVFCGRIAIWPEKGFRKEPRPEDTS